MLGLQCDGAACGHIGLLDGRFHGGGYRCRSLHHPQTECAAALTHRAGIRIRFAYGTKLHIPCQIVYRSGVTSVTDIGLDRGGSRGTSQRQLGGD